jgi:hypothetical protein
MKLKRQTPILLEDLDRNLLAAEADRVGTSWAAVVRKLIREHLAPSREAAK